METRTSPGRSSSIRPRRDNSTGACHGARCHGKLLCKMQVPGLPSSADLTPVRRVARQAC
eukprot:1314912-Rhodomonas_salina.2